MQVRARRVLVASACAAFLLPSAAGCVKLGAEQPPIVLPTLTSRPSPTGTGTPTSAGDVLTATQNSIVRIEGVDCAQSYATGSGFFFQPGFVVTTYHVVKDQQSLAVRTLSSRTGEDHVFTGRVVGHNDAADIAVVQVDDPDSETLTIAATDPAVNTPVYSIGYPGGQPINSETGRITGVDQDTVVTDGNNRRPLSGAIRFTAPPSAGTSGGPLIDAAGTTVGLVDTGTADDQVHFAVPGTLVKTLAAAAAASPEDKTPKPCEQSAADETVKIESSNPDAPGIATSVRAYVEGINAGDQVVDDKTGQTGFELAYQQLSGDRLETYPTLAKFRAAHRQRIANVVITSVRYVDDTTDTARLSYDYTTLATGVCAKRSMEYTMSIATGAWTFADEKVRKRGAC